MACSRGGGGCGITPMEAAGEDGGVEGGRPGVEERRSGKRDL